MTIIAKLGALVGLLWICGFANAGSVSEKEAFTILSKFKSVVLKGAFSEPQLITPGSFARIATLYPIADPSVYFCIEHDDGNCAILKANGKIQCYFTHIDFGGEGYPSRVRYSNYPHFPKLPPETIAKLAQQYVNAAGWEGTYVARHMDLEACNSIQSDAWNLVLRKVVQGVSIEDSVRMRIEPTTGTLMEFIHPEEMTALPSNLVPTFSVNDARVAILTKLASFGATQTIEIDPVELQAALPRYVDNDIKCHFTLDDLELTRAGQGKLLYYCKISELKDCHRYYEFWVDAHTNQIMYFWFAKDHFCISINRTPTHFGPHWDWGQGLVEIITPTTTVPVSASNIVDINPDKKPTIGFPVILKRGKAFTVALYDPSSRLLWFKKNEVVCYGKPNERLARVLDGLVKANKTLKQTMK